MKGRVCGVGVGVGGLPKGVGVGVVGVGVGGLQKGVVVVVVVVVVVGWGRKACLCLFGRRGGGDMRRAGKREATALGRGLPGA